MTEEAKQLFGTCPSTEECLTHAKSPVLTRIRFFVISKQVTVSERLLASPDKFVSEQQHDLGLPNGSQ